MKNMMSINPEILNMDKVVVWANGVGVRQKIICILTQLDVRFDAFCSDRLDIPYLLGKPVISVEELSAEEKSYAIIVPVDEYDDVVDKCRLYGISENNLFVWTDLSQNIIYCPA